jgi:hypothetical protein
LRIFHTFAESERLLFSPKFADIFLFEQDYLSKSIQRFLVRYKQTNSEKNESRNFRRLLLLGYFCAVY